MIQKYVYGMPFETDSVASFMEFAGSYPSQSDSEAQ